MTVKELRMIVDLFKYYYSNIFNRKGYRFNMTDRKKVTIHKFCKEIKRITNSKKLEDGYLRDYFEFQFNYWYKHESESEVKSVQIEWIVGAKAIARWIKADKSIAKFIVRKNLKTDVNFQSRLKKENYKNLVLNLSEVEESEKKIDFNTKKGFYNCLISTTLFNHKSSFCGDCKYSGDCKNYLKDKFPKINKARGYE